MQDMIIVCLQIYYINNLSNMIKHEYYHGYYISVKNKYDVKFYEIFFYNILGLWCLYKFINKYIKEDKIRDCLKSLIYYTLNVKLLYNYLPETEWYLNENMVKGYEDHEMSCRDKYMYIFSLSYYMLELMMFKNRKVNRKDDMEMLLHHVVTIMLIFISYSANLFRIGLNIVYLFDINDIFLCFSKLLTYYKFNNKITDTTFIIFFIGWVYNRLYVYMVNVLYILYMNMNTKVECISFGLLLVIYMLNLFWTKMIAMAGYKMYKGIELSEVSDQYEVEVN